MVVINSEDKTMVATLDKSGTMTLKEFFSLDDGTDAMYEFENGELIVMPAESEINRCVGVTLW